MPYFSVRITGGEDCRSAGLDARQTFNGKDADYSGVPNFFYVQRDYDRDTLQENVEGSLGGNYKVEVREIKEEEYNWKKHR